MIGARLFPRALLLAALCASAAGAASSLHPALRQRAGRGVFEGPGGAELLARAGNLAARIAARRACRADVCFALDGGGARLTLGDFAAQRAFAQVVVAVLATDAGARFSAAQYGAQVERVAAPTQDADALIAALQRARFQAAPRSFPGAAITFCQRELRDGPGADRIVLFSGPAEPFRPGALALAARAADASVLTATVGFGRPDPALRRAAAAAGAVTAATEAPVMPTLAPQVAQVSTAAVDISRPELLPDALEAAVEFLCDL